MGGLGEKDHSHPGGDAGKFISQDVPQGSTQAPPANGIKRLQRKVQKWSRRSHVHRYFCLQASVWIQKWNTSLSRQSNASIHFTRTMCMIERTLNRSRLPSRFSRETAAQGHHHEVSRRLLNDYSFRRGESAFKKVPKRRPVLWQVRQSHEQQTTKKPLIWQFTTFDLPTRYR